ncbi:MAG: AMP-binding protein [Actinomycetota bacterium]|nr:AMP-binding protein [Actinomycetota bacterium]
MSTAVEARPVPTAGAAATLPAMLLRHADTRAKAVALRAKRLGRWEESTWADYEHRAARIGLGLRELGIAAGDYIAVLADNRPEWLFADLGIQGIGAVTVGVYPTSAENQVAHILGDSQSKVVIVEDEEQFDKTLLVRDQLPQLAQIVVMDTRGIRSLEDAMSLEELEVLGEQRLRNAPGEWRDAVGALPGGDDAAIVVYTSGVGGPPQGVMLSHANLAAAATITTDFYGARPDEEVLSYLPLSHVAERLVSVVAAVRAGYVVNFGEGGESFPNDLREVQPTFFLGVPRVWERLMASVQFRMRNASWVKRQNYKFWQRRGAKAAQARMRGKRKGVLSGWIGWLMLHRTLRYKLGMSRIRIALSGAAPIAPTVLEYFWSLGIPTREVYGQTENTALATATPGDDVRIGKVGRALPGVELRIAEDGEVLVRSPGNFVGYVGDDAATLAAYHDGWLLTGDLGELDDDGFLSITGRKKDILITAGGVNVNPNRIENLLKVSPFIDEALVIGDGRPFLTVLIDIDNENVAAWAAQQGLPFTTQSDLVEKPEVRRLIEAAVSDVNSQLADTEQIRAFELIPVDLEETGALTPTHKVRRRQAVEQFSDLIERMYAR